MYIYLASSWRNSAYNGVLKILQAEGYGVYDFKKDGFQWQDIDIGFGFWEVKDWKEALKHPLAQDHFKQDKAALDKADVCVLLLPCGRSAHLEAGYMAAKGKSIYTLILDSFEPELMILLGGPPENICLEIPELLQCLKRKP